MSGQITLGTFFDRGRVDLEEAERHFRQGLLSLGIDSNCFDDMRKTPARAAKAFHDMWSIDPWEFTVFDSPQTDEGDYSDMGIVLQTNIPFRCVCRHHLLPFTGVGHIAYIPGSRYVGLSKLARTLQTVSSFPGVQEEIGLKIADFLVRALEPVGVAVILKAEHMCMSLRGPQVHSTNTVTSVLRGAFKTEPDARAELFALLAL